MTTAAILLSLFALAGIGFGYLYLYNYANDNYKFNIFGYGSLSIIPPALACIGFFVVDSRKENYLQSLLSGDLDIVLSLLAAVIAFVWVFRLFLRKTDWLVAILTMLLTPPIVIIGTIILLCAWGVSESSKQAERDRPYNNYDSNDDYWST
jgi:hypothetical protein